MGFRGRKRMWMATVAITIAAVAAVIIFFSLSCRVNLSKNVHGTDIPASAEPSAGIVADTGEIRLLFGGDMMFDRWIREKAMKKGNAFVFDGVRDEIRGHDATIANLEGPITDMGSKSIGSEIGSRDNYLFTFDPGWAKTLAEEGIGPVNLGNNHILNQEDDGISQTRKYLDTAGVSYFGDPTSDNRISILEIRGTRISFVNYDEFVPGGEEKAMTDIRQARASADFVILYAHWGSEYLPVRDDVRSLAYRFIDAGCDAVIGSHPHIVQEKESYRGGTIYYSLGNFIFDQYFREDTRKGLLISMTIDPVTRGFSFRDIPIVLKVDGSTAVYVR
ncbi:MAG: CapA family protein [Candidatus Moranbacteria bacterium]|nr:CapA family protein [Candidatus Moranbacteria bacterium]